MCFVGGSLRCMFRLPIPVHDVTAVKVLESSDDLTQVELGHVLGHHSFDLHTYPFQSCSGYGDSFSGIVLS